MEIWKNHKMSTEKNKTPLRLYNETDYEKVTSFFFIWNSRIFWIGNTKRFNKCYEDSDENGDDNNAVETENIAGFKEGVLVPETESIDETDQVILNTIKSNNAISHHSNDKNLKEAFKIFFDYLKSKY
jgi:hypothetical protein